MRRPDDWPSRHTFSERFDEGSFLMGGPVLRMTAASSLEWLRPV